MRQKVRKSLIPLEIGDPAVVPLRVIHK